MAQIDCFGCYDGKHDRCDECNIYKLVQASSNLDRLELEDLIDCMESCEREGLPMNTLLDLKTNGKVAKVLIGDTEIKPGDKENIVNINSNISW